MAYGELHLPPEISTRNLLTGRFLKGNKPANKGKKWDEYMTKKAQRRAMKGWKNLDLHRNKHGRPDTAGRCRKQVIAVFDDGSWKHFSYLGAASEWCGGSRENVGRCCRCNQERHISKKTGEINTDHKYKGVRFYFESDNIWTTKINNK